MISNTYQVRRAVALYVLEKSNCLSDLHPSSVVLGTVIFE